MMMMMMMTTTSTTVDVIGIYLFYLSINVFVRETYAEPPLL
jgi:hypothetical protein